MCRHTFDLPTPRFKAFRAARAAMAQWKENQAELDKLVTKDRAAGVPSGSTGDKYACPEHLRLSANVQIRPKVSFFPSQTKRSVEWRVLLRCASNQQAIVEGDRF